MAAPLALAQRRLEKKKKNQQYVQKLDGCDEFGHAPKIAVPPTLGDSRRPAHSKMADLFKTMTNTHRVEFGRPNNVKIISSLFFV